MTTTEKMTAYYNLVTDLAKKIGDLKGYDYAYLLPASGRMLVSHNGVNFLITAEALSDDMSLSDEMKRSYHLFTSHLVELEEKEKLEKISSEENPSGTN